MRARWPEFPNDNPLLWVISKPEPAPAPSIEFERVVEVAVCAEVEDEGDEIEIVDELEAVDADEHACDAFSIFLTTLADVASSAGGAEVAMQLPALLVAETFDAASPPEQTIASLLEGGLLARTDAGVARDDAFARTAQAWRRVLRGDDQDFDACGARTLDELAADIVAR